MHEMQARNKVNLYPNAPILNNKMHFAMRHSIALTSIVYSLGDNAFKKKKPNQQTISAPLSSLYPVSKK